MNPRLTVFLRSLAAVAVLGAVFGAAAGAALLQPPLVGAAAAAMSGVIDFTALTLIIGGAETFLPGTRAGIALARMPFLAMFGVKALAYGLVILGVVGGRLGPSSVATVLGEDVARSLLLQVDARFPVGLMIPVASLTAVLLLMLHQLRLLVGADTLRDIVFGRYHRARLEERFFLFVDIVGSTPLAERLGPAAANRFLARVFELASDPVDEYAGEVYQYVGDEMVITWKRDGGRPHARPLACYFAIEKVIAAHAAEFTRDFGAVPRLRAALHAGEVITGEVGGSRRAIVFHGDVMNTTSRIENATRELQRPFLVSEDALSRMLDKERYALEDLGARQLRGREGLVRLFAVSARTVSS